MILAALGYIPYRLIPLSVKEALRKRIADWSAKPIHLPLLGIVLAVVFIQFASRKCFVFGNVLLRKHLPDEWLSSVLLTNEARLSLYFSALLAGTLLTGGILLLILRGGASMGLKAVLCFTNQKQCSNTLHLSVTIRQRGVYYVLVRGMGAHQVPFQLRLKGSVYQLHCTRTC